MTRSTQPGAGTGRGPVPERPDAAEYTQARHLLRWRRVPAANVPNNGLSRIDAGDGTVLLVSCPTVEVWAVGAGVSHRDPACRRLRGATPVKSDRSWEDVSGWCKTCAPGPHEPAVMNVARAKAPDLVSLLDAVARHTRQPGRTEDQISALADLHRRITGTRWAGPLAPIAEAAATVTAELAHRPAGTHQPAALPAALEKASIVAVMGLDPAAGRATLGLRPPTTADEHAWTVLAPWAVERIWREWSAWLRKLDELAWRLASLEDLRLAALTRRVWEAEAPRAWPGRGEALRELVTAWCEQALALREQPRDTLIAVAPQGELRPEYRDEAKAALAHLHQTQVASVEVGKGISRKSWALVPVPAHLATYLLNLTEDVACIGPWRPGDTAAVIHDMITLAEEDPQRGWAAYRDSLEFTQANQA